MKPRKYRNTPTEVDGIRFASKREANRYSELKILERCGEIHELTLQPRFDIEVAGKKVATYVADFSYFRRTAKRVIEDAKGVRTPLYKLKKKLVEAMYGITIEEV